MELRLLKSKDVRYGLKRGMTMDDFLSKYECTENELEKHLKKLYKYNPDDIHYCMEKMSTNQRKRGKKDVPDPKPLPNIIIMEVPKEASPPEPSELEKLESRAAEINNEIAELEENYKTLSEKGRLYLKRLREAMVKIEEVKTLFECRYSECKTILLEYGQTVKAVDQIFINRQEKVAALDEIYDKIRALKKIILYVYDDCSISSDNDAVNIEDYDDGTLWQELLEKPECEDLRVKDIRALAKVLKITEHVADYEISFENPELEKVFESLVG